MTAPRRDPKRILLIRTDRLGETVLNLPVAAALKHACPRATLTWMVNPALVELLQSAPGVDRVLSYDQPSAAPWWLRAVNLATSWRSEQFDMAVVSNCTREFHVAAWLAGIPVRIGYDRKWGCLLTHRVTDRRALEDRHEVEYNMDVVAASGFPVPASPVLQLPVTDDAERRLSLYFQEHGLTRHEAVVVVHPWTSNPRKQWPLGHVRMFLERFGSRRSGCLLVVGSAEERLRSETLMSGVGSHARNAVGHFSLPVLAACLRRARVVVTTDSGPMHVAAAVGTPVVALFGTADAGSQPRRWGPWGSGHTVIQKPLEQMTVEEVAAAVEPYLLDAAAHSHR